MSKSILHLSFLWSKKLKAVTIILIILTGLVFLYQSNFFEGWQLVDANRVLFELDYIENSILHLKMSSVLYSIFLFSENHHGDNRKYVVLWLDGTNGKLSFQIYKHGLILCIFIFYLFNVYIIFLLIGNIILSYNISILLITSIYVKLGVQAIFYGIVSAVMMEIIPHITTMIFSILLFWMTEYFYVSSTINDTNFMNQLFQVVPTVVSIDGKYLFVAETYQYVVVIFTLFILLVLMSVKSEIQ